MQASYRFETSSAKVSQMDKPKTFSRRTWLKTVVVTASALATYPLLGQRAVASPQSKLAKAAVHYQDHPNGRKMCGMCVHFVTPGGTAGHGMMGAMGPGRMGTMHAMGPGMMNDGSCQLVQGRIAPMGYCILYMPVRP